MSLKDRIRIFALRNPVWISGGHYEKLAMGIGKKASNASRRLRELHQAGILERREVGGYVEYRYRQSAVVTSDYFPAREKVKEEQKPLQASLI